MKYPIFLVFPVTYRCNCRCKMCTIWQKQRESKDIPLDLLKKVFNEPILSKHLEYVNLTGGEPFLRPDLLELTEMFVRTCSRMHTFTVASNGLMGDKIVEKTLKMLSIIPDNVNTYWSFSLDGPRQVHDEIRGRKGCYDAVIQTVKTLIPLKKKYPNFSVGFNATLGHFNYEYAEEIKRIAESLGVGVGYTTANVVDTFIDSASSEWDFTLKDDEKKELQRFFRLLYEKSPNPYWQMVIHMLEGGRRTMSCLARKQGVLIDIDGSVYHCGQSAELALGNIYKETFRKIWTGKRARIVALKIHRECAYCLTNCYPAKSWWSEIKDFILGRKG